MNNKIYLPPINAIEVESLQDLIKSLYMDENGLLQTNARATFHDTEFTQLQCGYAKRSFEDLLCLAQTYFPETTEKDLMSVLKELSIGCWYCRDVQKMVFFNTAAAYLALAVSLATQAKATEDYPANRPFAVGTKTAKELLEVYNQL
jgi:hypothetical protein